MYIERIQMTRPHYQVGRPGRVRMIVLHATAGRAPGDLGWLRAGGDERRPVSAHYYIDKQGRIVQLVDDADTAWHAGQSSWPVDGQKVSGCNPVSIGVELENLNSGRDPYPAAQYAAALWLCRQLAARHDVPRAQLVRHLDIAPGRKGDPAGFPWERFVAEVYADLATDAPGSPDLDAQLQACLLDLAYRSAGGAISAGWPFFASAQAARLGMPVAAPAARRAAASAAQDDHDRAVRLGDQGTFLVEIYAGDLLYAPISFASDSPPDAAEVRRLGQTPAGPLRDALLGLLFRQADPVNGFRPAWAHHQRYLRNAASLGVPIGPSQRIPGPAGRPYVCQHFALDSLCSPIDSWKTIYRLSDLSGGRALPGLAVAEAAALRRTLFDSLYRERAGRQFDERAALVRYALDHTLGAPLGPAEQIEIEGEPFLLMPFAKSVIACRLPAADWPYDRPLPEGTRVDGLCGTLGAAGDQRPSVISGRLLGQEQARPHIHDLSEERAVGPLRPRAQVDRLVLWPAPGPAAADIAAGGSAVCWHYYIQQDGTIARLRNDLAPPCAGWTANTGAAQIVQRAVVLACEGAPWGTGPQQRASIAWLIRILSASLRLDPHQIHVLSPPPPRFASGIIQ